MRSVLTILSASLCLSAGAQFAPQAGVQGSTAISADDKSIAGWAISCDVQRGWLDIADKSKGVVSLGTPDEGKGKSDGRIVSLGDSGIAVLKFATPIYNGAGPDFVVFENGFLNGVNPEEAFLELAFVEVSSDGVNYFRFPSESQVPAPQIPVAGVYTSARYINNLAGKYISGYGTPFDLEELRLIMPSLDVDNITHVRIVDVIGSISGNGSMDSKGNAINDPYPTPVPGGGFDLDAVGAIYLKGMPAGVTEKDNMPFTVFPNPATEYIKVSVNNSIAKYKVAIADMSGRVLYNNVLSQDGIISLSEFSKGIYFLSLQDDKGNKWVERISRL
jgi:hypothetical protein